MNHHTSNAYMVGESSCHHCFPSASDSSQLSSASSNPCLNLTPRSCVANTLFSTPNAISYRPRYRSANHLQHDAAWQTFVKWTFAHCAVQKSFGSFQITSSDFKFEVDPLDHWACSSFGIHHINVLTPTKPLWRHTSHFPQLWLVCS